MSAVTLVVDDRESLVETLRETSKRIGAKGAEFFTSLRDARTAASKGSYKRFIADQVFEDENGSGIDFLEEMRERQPDAELILLTGKYLSPQNQEKLFNIGASPIKKAQLTADLLGLILSSAPLPSRGLTGEVDVDIAELRIRYDDLARQIVDIRQLNDLLVEDIISELSSIRDQNAPSVMIGNRSLSALELRGELENRTELGRELIRLHHELYRHLRDKS